MGHEQEQILSFLKKMAGGMLFPWKRVYGWFREANSRPSQGVLIMKTIYLAIAILFACSTAAQAGDIFKNMQHNWQNGAKRIGNTISHGIEQRQERRQNFANNLTKGWNNAANNRQERRENRANTINKAYHNTIDHIDKQRHNRADNMNQAVKNVRGHHHGHGNDHHDDYYDDYYYRYNDHWNNRWYSGTNVVVAIDPGPVYYNAGYGNGYYGESGSFYAGTCADVLLQPGYWMKDAWGNAVYVNPRIGRVCQ
jgi:hypothetical protein